MSKNDGVVSEEIKRVSPVVPTYGREVMGIFIVGAIVGLIVAVSYYLLEKYIFSAVLCRDGADMTCSQAPTYATIVSMVIGAIFGLLGLVQGRVYRPLLIIIASFVSLWGLADIVADLSWYWSGLASVLFFAFTFLLYAWVARIRSFVLASIITITLFVLASVIVMS